MLLNNVGFIYAQRGDLDRAVEYVQGAIAIDEQLAPTSSDAAVSQKVLGDVFMLRNELDDARRHWQRALEIGGLPSSVTAQVLYLVGCAYGQQGDLNQSSVWLEKALPGAREVGPEETAKCLTALGEISQQRGDLERAQRYFEEALALSEATSE